MIRRVLINGFKRFDSVEFVLPGHIVVAGPNNTGKTTLLQAIAAWSLALKRWKELNDFQRHGGHYTKAPIARQAFSPVPLRAFDLLWRDRQYRGTITVEIRTDEWSLKMMLVADSTEQIYVADRDGNEIRPLTTRDGLIYFEVAWSPDSRAIAALACKPDRVIHLCWFVRGWDDAYDVLSLYELQENNPGFTFSIYAGLNGDEQAQTVRNLLAWHVGSLHAAGASRFVGATRAAFLASGLPETDFYADSFGDPVELG